MASTRIQPFKHSLETPRERVIAKSTRFFYRKARPNKESRENLEAKYNKMAMLRCICSKIIPLNPGDTDGFA